MGLVCPCHSSKLVKPSPSGSCSKTSASAMGRPNCSIHSFGTGGCTSVVCRVAGCPSVPMKCFFRNKKPGTPAKGPLRWLPQFLQGIFNLLRFARRRSGPLRGVGLQLSELRLEPNRALEYAKRAHQEDHDTRDQNDALVIFLQPVHQRNVLPRLVLANRSPVIPSEYASPARTEESLTIFCSIELRLRGRTRVITV